MQTAKMYKSMETIVLIRLFKAQCNATGSYSDHSHDFLGGLGCQIHEACAFNTI